MVKQKKLTKEYYTPKETIEILGIKIIEVVKAISHQFEHPDNYSYWVTAHFLDEGHHFLVYCGNPHSSNLLFNGIVEHFKNYLKEEQFKLDLEEINCGKW